MRKAGFRTVRISLTPVRRGASSLCFDRTIRLTSPDDLHAIAPLLEDENIVDIQTIDSLLVDTVEGLRHLADNPRLAGWERRAAVVDKPFVSEEVRRRGLRSPKLLTDPEVKACEVIAELGLPVVHKVRRGSSGDGVRVIANRDELDRLFAAGGHTSEHFFEQFVDGRHLQFAGVVADCGRGLSVTYHTLERMGSMGPASEIRCVNDAVLDEIGHTVADGFGIEGMINVNVIRDADGEYWIHDVNPRVWGSCVSFRAVGLDFLRTYAEYLRGTPIDREVAAPDESTIVSVFPASLQGHAADEGWVRRQRRFLRAARPFAGWVGTRYVARELGRELTSRT